jgi:DNA (cytosine-5)-methyltransferase 1
MAEKNSNWMSIGDAAKYLGLSRDTLRRWEKAGKIKPVRSPTNRRYYTKNILDEALSAKKEGKFKKTVRPTKKPTGSKWVKIILAGTGSLALALIIGLVAVFFLLG